MVDPSGFGRNLGAIARFRAGWTAHRAVQIRLPHFDARNGVSSRDKTRLLRHPLGLATRRTLKRLHLGDRGVDSRSTSPCAESIRRPLQDVRKSIPFAVRVEIVFNSSAEIKHSIDDVKYTLVLTFCLFSR